MNSTFKTVVLWVALLLVGVVLWTVITKSANGAKDQEISYSQFTQYVGNDDVSEVTISGTEARGKLRNEKTQFHLVIPANNPEMWKDLKAHNVNTILKDNQGAGWLMVLFQFSPVLLVGVLFFIMIRQMQSGGNKALSFGKSRARLLSMQQKKITFKDVAGVDEAKEELREIIEFLREAQKFQKLGGRIPKGVCPRSV